MNKVSHQRYNINQTECMIWPFLSLHGRRSFPGLPDFRDRLPCRLAISGSSDFDIFPARMQPDPPNHSGRRFKKHIPGYWSREGTGTNSEMVQIPVCKACSTSYRILGEFLDKIYRKYNESFG